MRLLSLLIRLRRKTNKEKPPEIIRFINCMHCTCVTQSMGTIIRDGGQSTGLVRTGDRIQFVLFRMASTANIYVHYKISNYNESQTIGKK